MLHYYMTCLQMLVWILEIYISFFFTCTNANFTGIFYEYISIYYENFFTFFKMCKMRENPYVTKLMDIKVQTWTKNRFIVLLSRQCSSCSLYYNKLHDHLCLDKSLVAFSQWVFKSLECESDRQQPWVRKDEWCIVTGVCVCVCFMSDQEHHLNL